MSEESRSGYTRCGKRRGKAPRRRFRSVPLQKSAAVARCSLAAVTEARTAHAEEVRAVANANRQRKKCSSRIRSETRLQDEGEQDATSVESVESDMAPRATHRVRGIVNGRIIAARDDGLFAEHQPRPVLLPRRRVIDANLFRHAAGRGSGDA